MPAELTRNARILATVGVGLALFLAALAQPIVGTALPRIVADLSWRWVFYVTVPVGILAILVCLVTLPYVAHKASWRDIDFAGAFTLTATLVPLLIALSITQDHDIASPEVIGLLGIAAVMAVIFFIIERRDRHPIVPFELWKNPTYTVSTIIGFLAGVALVGAA